MTMHLLERDQYLAALEALREAASGHGRIALISGEAGIGKTALVERFVAQAPSACCPARSVGRVRGALHPAPPRPALRHRAADRSRRSARSWMARRTARRSSPPSWMNSPRSPAILVIEDIHWADEATLDLIKYLGRRIPRTPSCSS